MSAPEPLPTMAEIFERVAQAAAAAPGRWTSRQIESARREEIQRVSRLVQGRRRLAAGDPATWR